MSCAGWEVDKNVDKYKKWCKNGKWTKGINEAGVKETVDDAEGESGWW